MPADATASLLKAVRSALVGDVTLSGLVGNRVYSRWGSGDTSQPWLRLSVPIVADYEDDCGDGSSYELNVHCYTRDGITARDIIAARVRTVLDGADLTLDGASLLWLDYSQTIRVPDPDDPEVLAAVLRFDAVSIVPA